MKFLIPQSLDLNKIILEKPTHQVFRRVTVDGKRKFESVPTKSKSLLKHIPYCYYIIDLILNKSLTDKSNSYGYINLRTELIDGIIPSHSRLQVMSLLQVLNIIQINHSYNIGEFSKSYRIHPSIDITNKVYVDIKGQYIGTYTITSLREEGRKSLCTVLFDKEKRLENKVKLQLQAKTSDLLKYPEYDYQQQNIFNINLDYEQLQIDGINDDMIPFIEKVNNGVDLGINVNNSVNRVFTPVTNLKKEYRKYLLDKDNCSLMEIDFKSSHLFHLLKEINESSPSVELQQEIDMVKDIALNGDIYQYVANQPVLADYHLTRDAAKDLFIKSFLYGMFPNRIKTIQVKSIFPLMTKHLDAKTRKLRSIDLQRSESYLVNRMIMKRIAVECNDITIYGIFDSVLVDENNYDQVYRIMEEESFKYFGYEVPLEGKQVCPDDVVKSPVLAKTLIQMVNNQLLDLFDMDQKINGGVNIYYNYKGEKQLKTILK